VPQTQLKVPPPPYKRLHLESSKRNFYIISFTSNNKSNLHSYIYIFLHPQETAISGK